MGKFMSYASEIYLAKLSSVQAKLDTYAAKTGIKMPVFSSLLTEATENLETETTSDASSYASLGSALGYTSSDSKSSSTDFLSLYTNSYLQDILSGTTGSTSNLTTSEKQALYKTAIDQAAQTYGVDADLIRAIIQVESSFNANATSSSGAQGLMQLMPKTASSLGVSNSYDPTQNINGGTKYIAQMIEKFGDVKLALAAYNTGPGNISKLGITNADDSSQYSKISSGVRGYVDKVLGYYEAFKQQNQEVV